MKILFLTNNEISHTLIEWLHHEAGETLIVKDSMISKDVIESDRPDFLISYNYRHIIKKDVLEMLKDRAINLHISLLPWNRGAHPNIWSFVENTPKGVTIHLIDEGIDTGDIIAQEEVDFDEDKETLASSYLMLHKEIQELFKSHWQQIRSFQIVPQSQPRGGSIHYVKDFEQIKGIIEDKGWDITVTELRRLMNHTRGGSA